MKIDELGCVIMEQWGPPADLGDSCAETGRYVVLGGNPDAVNLRRFLSQTGYLRHPDVPPDWRETDFTNDQGNFLLQGAFLSDCTLFRAIVSDLRAKGWRWHPKGHRASLEARAIAKQNWNLLGFYQVAQILINKLPYRWSDAHDRTGFWNYWRFERSEGSTISFVTTYVTMVFLYRIGVEWPLRHMDEEKYVARAKAYYAVQPNSAWFTELYDKGFSSHRTPGMRC